MYSLQIFLALFSNQWMFEKTKFCANTLFLPGIEQFQIIMLNEPSKFFIGLATKSCKKIQLSIFFQSNKIERKLTYGWASFHDCCSSSNRATAIPLIFIVIVLTKSFILSKNILRIVNYDASPAKH